MSINFSKIVRPSYTIAEFAKQRWRQIWTDKNGITMQFQEDGCDDIGVARICYDVNAIIV